MRSRGACATGAATLAAVVALLASAPATATHQGGLVGHWPLDVVDDTDSTPDVSGHGRHGDAASLEPVPGRFAGAQRFGDNASRVTLPEPDGAFEVARPSVLAWVMRSGAPGANRWVFAKGATECAFASYGLHTTAGGELRFMVRGPGGTVARSPAAGSDIWDGRWHAVAGTYDGSRVRLYVDGREVGDGSPMSAPVEYALPKSEPTIGTLPGCDGTFADAAIDDVRVYARALGEADIRAAQGFPAENGPAPPGPAPPAPPAEEPYVPARAAFTPSATRLAAGTTVRLDARASLPPGAVARSFAWSLDRDPAPEAVCDPETPVLEANLTRPGAVTARLTVTDARGAVTTATAALTVSAAPRVATSRAGAIGRALRTVQARTTRAEPMPVCRPAARSDVALVDVTAFGGPAAGCVEKTEAYAALVSVVGCLRQVDDWGDVPAAERNLLRGWLASALGVPAASLVRAGGAQRIGPRQQAGAIRAFDSLLSDRIYVADGPVRVNGLDYVPSPGASVVIVAPGIFSDETPRLLSSRVKITAPTDLPRQIELRKPEDLRLPLDRKGFEVARIPVSTGVAFIPGTRLQGSVRTTLERYRSRVAVKVRLPDDFLLRTGAGVAVETELVASNRDGIRLDGFGVRNVDAMLYGVGVHVDHLRYVASQRRFEGAASIAFQPLGHIDGTLHVRGSAVELLNITYFPGAPGIKVAPGVFLSEVNAYYENSPSAVRFGGGAAFTGGPSAGNGCGLVGVRGDFDFRIEPEPVTLTVAGTGSLVCIPLFRATAVLAADGYVSVGAGIDYALGPFSLRAGWDVRYHDLRFTAEAGARGCIDDYGCIGGTALVSDRGLAFCGDFGWFDAGAGLDWPPGPSLPAIIARLDIMFPTCDVGRWRTVRARAAQAGGTIAIDVPSGGRGVVTGVVGAERAPRLRLRGPRGHVVEMPVRGPVRSATVVAFRTAERRTTFVALREAGRWTVEVLDGTRVAEVRRASIEPDPVVRGAVRRAGGRRVLRYETRNVSGQVVRFFERAPGGMRELGRARGARGTLRFTPSDARGSAREIVALVERDGTPREQIRVARFTATPPRIGRPRRIRAWRTGGALRVSFRGAPNAIRHLVGVELSDGRSLELTARRGTRSVRIPRVARGTRVTIRVAGVRGARRGPVAVARRRT
jgi:hypothetical protein